MLGGMAERITGEEPTLMVSDGAPSPSLSTTGTSTPLRHVFAGRYEVLGLVGKGGMGTVYRARDKELDEVVALKLLRRDLLEQPGMLERFRQEVKLARRVTHRNVARTFDIGESEGEKFLTMEFVEGEPLSARLARDGRLSLDVVLAVGEGICSGLSAAHAAGVVHRDLKPDNVLLASDGRVVVTDFGIARALSDADRAATVGVALGTPTYMAPEQVEGVKDLDARADIYALGAMLYECFTGEHAWSGDSVWSVAAARLFQPPPDPRARRADVPALAAELILRCMARRREDRFADVGEVAVAMAAIKRPTIAPPPGPPLTGAPTQVTIDSDAKTVAVLPFRNAGASTDDYFAEGLSDDLIDALSMTPGLRVLAKGALARFKGPERDAREIGRELRVDVVVDGSLRRMGEILRVAARVVSVADGFQLWAKRFDRPEREVLRVSDEAADAIADALTLRRNAPARPPPSDGRTIDLYLRARHVLRLGGPGNVFQAISVFEEALAIAPNDPTVLAGYATAQLRRFTFDTETSEGLAAEQKGIESAEKALSIAPHLGEARAALATHQWVLGDPMECARQLREAIRIAPSSTELKELYGRMLLEIGEPERGLAMLTAVAALEPRMGMVAGDLASGDIIRGRALMGDWSLLDAALESPLKEDALVSPRYVNIARLCLWRKDRTNASRLRAIIEKSSFALRDVVLRMIDLFEPDRARAFTDEQLALGGRVTGRARRRPAFFRQLAAEALAFSGDVEGVVKALTAGDELGLVDVTWADRCPLFETMRTQPDFVLVRDRIAARARATLEVLEWREASV
jgi:TolB-like protein/tRNA A-37 threonylcarbamoyl transferase component Bud32